MAKAKLINSKINGDFVKENHVTELKIQSIPDFGTYQKLECEVQCNDESKTKGKWTISKQPNNALIKKWGDDTDNWVGKIVPVKAENYETGWGIVVDTTRLEAL